MYIKVKEESNISRFTLKNAFKAIKGMENVDVVGCVKECESNTIKMTNVDNIL